MDLGLTFLAGVFGSMHCIGMCGAIVLAYSSAAVKGGRGSGAGITAHLLYNGGRVISYTLIGGLAGFVGGVVGSVESIGPGFSVAAGSLMVIMGIFMLGIIRGRQVWEGGEQTWFRRMHISWVANLLSLNTSESRFYIGLLTPLLPCGLLYSMLLKAAATGSPWTGALTMFVFGAGIVPALLLTGMLSVYAGIRLRQYANRLAALTIILMGITLVLRGAGVPFPFVAGMQHDGGMHHVH